MPHRVVAVERVSPGDDGTAVAASSMRSPVRAEDPDRVADLLFNHVD